MNKVLKKLKIKCVNNFKHTINVGMKILAVVVKTALICFGIGIALIIINTILGVHIRLSYYMMLSSLVTLSISLLLVLINWKNINSKYFKVPKKTVPTTQKVRTQKRTQKRIQRNRRNIS